MASFASVGLDWCFTSFGWPCSNSKPTFSHASYAASALPIPPPYVGYGPGLVTRYLAASFFRVIGTDPSQGIIEQARSSTSKQGFPNVKLREASAEQSPFLSDGSVDMVVTGQAAHWFDYPKLFPEMKRILRPGGTLAFWGYKDPVFPDYPKATKILDEYSYGNDERSLGLHWSQPGRSILQNKLRDIKPPTSDWEDIERVEYEPRTSGPRTGEGTMFLNRTIKIGECKSYVRKWSSFHSWQEQHPEQIRREEGGPGDLADEMFDKMLIEDPEWQAEDLWEEKEVEIEWASGLLLARRK